MAKRHRLLINGRERTVVLDDQGGRVLVTLDGGEPFEVEVISHSVPGALSMVVGGAPRRAYVTRAAGGFDVIVDSRRFRVLPAGRGRARGAIGKEDEPGKITSPLAGVVMEIRVAAGDPVSEGQAVAVVEAMKMQNEIQCPHAGTVTAVHVEQGQRVEQGGLLVEYEPEV